jgi:hypothetical protein
VRPASWSGWRSMGRGKRCRRRFHDSPGREVTAFDKKVDAQRCSTMDRGRWCRQLRAPDDGENDRRGVGARPDWRATPPAGTALLRWADVHDSNIAETFGKHQLAGRRPSGARGSTRMGPGARQDESARAAVGAMLPARAD